MKITKLILGGAALMVLSVPAAFAQSSATDPNPQTIHQRKENQQDRIAQGVKSGQLTPGETAKLERQEGAINRETRAMRAANGGKLSPADKRIVNRQQNRESRRIYAKKHNGRTQ
ncbi:MAG: hypothetical protein WB987_05055 [Candidatus Acidiferrales bacterium]